MIRQESLFIPAGPSGAEKLHVRRLYASSPAAGTANPPGLEGSKERLGPPVLLLHGAIENARIFYTESGKGLGPYLARRGFEVYAADLRGRGLSEPRITRRSAYGQFESITEDLTAFRELIRSRRGDVPQLWIGHSWGGVLQLAHLARFDEARRQVAGLVFFGTKRSVHVRNLEKSIKIDFFWKHAARALTRVVGYLPARELRVGSDNETRLSHEESRLWVRPGPWVDPRDGFDYESAFARAELPPMLFFAARNDACLGNPLDVRALIRELGPQEVEFRLLGRGTGSLRDYGHVDMLTHPDAEQDHFPETVRFLKAQVRSGEA